MTGKEKEMNIAPSITGKKKPFPVPLLDASLPLGYHNIQ